MEDSKPLLDDEMMQCDDKDESQTANLMDRIFGNDIIVHEILAGLSVKDRNNAKLVCWKFRQELKRTKFLEDEYISLRKTHFDEDLDEVDLVLPYRSIINLALRDIDSFEDQPMNIWSVYGDRIKRIVFERSGLNVDLFLMIASFCKNLLEVYVVHCSFEHDPGWKHLKPEEEEVLRTFSADPERVKPKRKEGILYFPPHFEPYLRWFVGFCNFIYVYVDDANVKTFVFEWQDSPVLLACDCSTEKGESITFYTPMMLDPNPNLLKGWSSFRGHRHASKMIDANAENIYPNFQSTYTNQNPKWVTLDTDLKLKKFIMKPQSKSRGPSLIYYERTPF